MKAKTVLVPLDGSPMAEEALGTAIGGLRAGATLLLVRAVEAHGSPFEEPSERQVAAIQEAETYLAGVADRMDRMGVKDVATSVWYGAPVESIADAARYRNAELIVMTTHGRSGLRRLLLGSVAEGVLRATTTPVLLLRPRKSAPVLDPTFWEEATLV
jgi:nucleotide-binding universal stress UspA family protein